MSIPLIVNGTTYNYPTDNEPDWGYQASEWAKAITENAGAGGSGSGIGGIESIQVLRDYTRPPTQTKVNVTSYYGDMSLGGGGIYYLDNDDITTPDDGGYCVIASDGSKWKLYIENELNVKNFGAKGDGIQDDTPFIQRCVTTAGALKLGVYIPSGQYMIQPQGEGNFMWLTGFSNRKNYSCIWMPSNITIRGDGETSHIKLIGTPPSPGTIDGRGDYSTTHMFVNNGSSTGLTKLMTNENIHITQLKFDGNLIQQSGEGVSLCGTRNFSITHCTFTQSFYETMYIVYSRGGNIVDNIMYSNGEYQWDGGGPLIDTCTHVNCSDNIITDCGYYAILAIDCWYSSFNNNLVQPNTYLTATGFQSIRVQGCQSCTVTGNKVYNSGYSAIWIHSGNNVLVSDNYCVYAGYGAGGGNQMSGIFVDGTPANDKGEHILKNNTCMFNKGSGMIVVGMLTEGTTQTQGHKGHLIEGNNLSYNLRDGLSLYGDYHRVIGNLCKSNSLDASTHTGILGDGYNGIGLNGAQWCIVTNNVCTADAPGIVNFNLDASIGSIANPPISVNVPAIYQNYGIVEYPHNPIAEYPTQLLHDGVHTSSTAVAPIKSVSQNIIKAIFPAGHSFQVGDVINVSGSDYEENISGYWAVFEIGSNYLKFHINDIPITPITFSPNPKFIIEKVTVASNNMIINNNIMGNLANPSVGAGGGYRAYSGIPYALPLGLSWTLIPGYDQLIVGTVVVTRDGNPTGSLNSNFIDAGIGSIISNNFGQ